MELERLVAALALIIAGWAAYRAYGWYTLRKVDLDVEGYRPGKPAILYFTDPGCAPCLQVQDPALEEIALRFGDDLQILKVQALEYPNLTDAWGVLSLPTTFIIDASGQPRGVNHGVARAAKLADQLAAIDEAFVQRAEAGTIDTVR